PAGASLFRERALLHGGASLEAGAGHLRPRVGGRGCSATRRRRANPVRRTGIRLAYRSLKSDHERLLAASTLPFTPCSGSGSCPAGVGDVRCARTPALRLS